MSQGHDEYTVLGVSRFDDRKTIANAYRSLLKKYHPDTSLTPDREKLNEIIRAYEAVKKRTIKERGFDSASLTELGRRYMQASGPAEKILTIHLLTLKGRVAAYRYIRRGLFDPDEKVVLASLRAVGFLKIHQASGDLDSLFRSRNLKVRESVLETIGRIGYNSGFRSILLAGSKDGERRIRRISSSILGEMERGHGG